MYEGGLTRRKGPLPTTVSPGGRWMGSPPSTGTRSKSDICSLEALVEKYTTTQTFTVELKEVWKLHMIYLASQSLSVFIQLLSDCWNRHESSAKLTTSRAAVHFYFCLPALVAKCIIIYVWGLKLKAAGQKQKHAQLFFSCQRHNSKLPGCSGACAVAQFLRFVACRQSWIISI